jgi:hypothetical protein
MPGHLFYILTIYKKYRSERIILITYDHNPHNHIFLKIDLANT